MFSRLHLNSFNFFKLLLKLSDASSAGLRWISTQEWTRHSMLELGRGQGQHPASEGFMAREKEPVLGAKGAGRGFCCVRGGG